MNEKIFDSDFIERLEHLSMQIQQVMNYGTAGNRKSKAKGMSVEFSDYREYSIGDDYRRIDWNAYSRFKKLYIKLFMEEKEAVFRLIIDDSRSMMYNEKNVMALRLASAFSYLALNNLDRVLITPIHSKENNIFLGQGKNAFMKYIDYLGNINFNKKETDFTRLKRLNYNGRGISIIFSDLLVNVNMEELLKFLIYSKQQVIIIQILSPEELHPNIDGRIKLMDSETGKEKNLMITPYLLKKYNEKAKAYTQQLSNTCRKYGASYIQVLTNEPIEKVFLEKLMETNIINH